MGVASVAETVARVRGRQPKLCRESVRTLGHPHLYDGSRAHRELGLHYTPVRQALEATVRWYVRQGLVTRTLPRIAAESPAPEPAPPETPEGPGASLFEPPPGRQRERSP
jgi:dihydroflavonol-4-reductase